MRYPGRQAVTHCILGCVVATCREVDGEWFRDKKKLYQQILGTLVLPYTSSVLCVRESGPWGKVLTCFNPLELQRTKEKIRNETKICTYQFTIYQ